MECPNLGCLFRVHHESEIRDNVFLGVNINLNTFIMRIRIKFRICFDLKFQLIIKSSVLSLNLYYKNSLNKVKRGNRTAYILNSMTL